MRRLKRPALGGVRGHLRRQMLDLLLNGLLLDPVTGRDAAVDRYSHDTSPAGLGAPAPRSAQEEALPPIAGAAGRTGPSAAGRSPSAPPAGGHRLAGPPDVPGALLPHAPLGEELPQRRGGVASAA